MYSLLRQWVLLAGLVVFLLPISLHGRGGGGCIEQGAMIATPTGPVAIERLRPGDQVYAFTNGIKSAAYVQDVMVVNPVEYIEIITGNAVLHLTAEHPLAIGNGVFCVASKLQSGQNVLLDQPAGLGESTLQSVHTVAASFPAYNLVVAPGGTYMANGIVVHNKGCFLPETQIRKSDGTEVSISAIHVGDEVTSFTAQGTIVTTSVRKIITHQVEGYCEVRTENIVLKVTSEHPFFIGNGVFKTLEALQVGDEIMAYDDAVLSPQRILSIVPIATPCIVFNLQTDAPHTYLANGIAVHNKGGGFRGGGFRGSSHRSHSSGSSSAGNSNGGSPPIIVFIFVGIVGVFIILSFKSNSKRTELDHLFRKSQIKLKSGKTAKLLQFLSRQDSVMHEESLRARAEATFRKLQECWQARSYAPMRTLLMPDLYKRHCAQIDGMIRSHEINRLDGLYIEAIDIVNVRYPFKDNQREFTVLFTARAMDYYVDDRTGRTVRGDTALARFQEFWTFQYWDKAWLLREIEQTQESDALKDENFFEQFTDVGLNQIYAEEAGRTGVSGPSLEKSIELKETRIERLLNFLVETDKLWNRQAMLETARLVYSGFITAMETNREEDVPKELFPQMAQRLGDELKSDRAKNTTREYRNFCIRKAELILVRNYADNTRDEFIVRIRAHAQRIIKHGAKIVLMDDDVTPWERYLTFGRHENQWKLKEIMNNADGDQAVDCENFDEGSSQQQLEWFYQNKRTV